MARKPFVVIDAEILSSSVWSEEPHVRLVWLTMLILCDTEGYVGAAVPGIARAAGVTVPQAREALARLMAPDPDSRTKTDDGRRVREVERGFLVLNFKEHLSRLSRERTKSRERVRRYREKKRLERYGNVTVTAGKREKGIGNRDKTEGTEDPPALPPADRVERAIRLSKEALITKLYGLIDEATRVDPRHRDPTELMRLFSSYEMADGRSVKGVVNAAQLTYERLERSITDAETQIAEWKNGTRPEKRT